MTWQPFCIHRGQSSLDERQTEQASERMIIYRFSKKKTSKSGDVPSRLPLPPLPFQQVLRPMTGSNPIRVQITRRKTERQQLSPSPHVPPATWSFQLLEAFTSNSLRTFFFPLLFLFRCPWHCRPSSFLAHTSSYTRGWLVFFVHFVLERMRGIHERCS